jgi:hypothetical protein
MGEKGKKRKAKSRGVLKRRESGKKFTTSCVFLFFAFLSSLSEFLPFGGWLWSPALLSVLPTGFRRYEWVVNEHR